MDKCKHKTFNICGLRDDTFQACRFYAKLRTEKHKGVVDIARKKYVQSFSCPKPSTIEEALERVALAQERYDDAVFVQQKDRWKRGRQRRQNQVKWAENALNHAKAELEETRNLNQLCLIS